MAKQKEIIYKGKHHHLHSQSHIFFFSSLKFIFSPKKFYDLNKLEQERTEEEQNLENLNHQQININKNLTKIRQAR